MQRRSGIGFVLLLPLLLPVATSARGQSGDRHLGACEADVEKLCAEVEPGSLRVIPCLKRNRDALSAECRSALGDKRQQAAERVERLQQACQSETQRWCPQLGGPMHLVGCLQKHRDELSETCRDAMPQQAPRAAPKPAAETPESAEPAR